jgi:hypothetical protein
VAPLKGHEIHFGLLFSYMQSNRPGREFALEKLFIGQIRRHNQPLAIDHLSKAWHVDTGDY